jgi:hypothetical protein
MEQFFILREHAKLSMFEQNNLTGEERKWYVERLNKERKEQNKDVESKVPSLPRIPKK